LGGIKPGIAAINEKQESGLETGGGSCQRKIRTLPKKKERDPIKWKQKI